MIHISSEILLICTKVNEVLSRAILLRNILVAVLREVKFFSPDSFFDDPKIFLPLRLRDREDRQRYAV
jgi:hypothetical protein